MSDSRRSGHRFWSPARVGGAVALGAWSGLFWFVLLADRSSLYLSPRVSWIIPVGAVLLTIVALGQVATARTARPERLTLRSTAALVLVVLPAVAILVLPPATLGSFAASRRSAANESVSREVRFAPGLEIDLPLVVAATRSSTTLEILDEVIRDRGPRVSFEGFVTLEGAPTDGFVLSRFIIACCVADAVTAQIPVTGAPIEGLEQDDWVRVTGDLRIAGSRILLQAKEVRRIPQPEQPYLWAA